MANSEDVTRITAESLEVLGAKYSYLVNNYPVGLRERLLKLFGCIDESLRTEEFLLLVRDMHFRLNRVVGITNIPHDVDVQLNGKQKKELRTVKYLAPKFRGEITEEEISDVGNIQVKEKYKQVNPQYTSLINEFEDDVLRRTNSIECTKAVGNNKLNDEDKQEAARQVLQSTRHLRPNKMIVFSDVSKTVYLFTAAQSGEEAALNAELVIFRIYEDQNRSKVVDYGFLFPTKSSRNYFYRLIKYIPGKDNIVVIDLEE